MHILFLSCIWLFPRKACESFPVVFSLMKVVPDLSTAACGSTAGFVVGYGVPGCRSSLAFPVLLLRSIKNQISKERWAQRQCQPRKPCLLVQDSHMLCFHLPPEHPLCFEFLECSEPSICRIWSWDFFFFNCIVTLISSTALFFVSFGPLLSVLSSYLGVSCFILLMPCRDFWTLIHFLSIPWSFFFFFSFWAIAAATIALALRHWLPFFAFLSFSFCLWWIRCFLITRIKNILQGPASEAA